MKTPEFLKSKRRKREERTIGLIVASMGLVIAAKDYHDRKKKEELELERMRLENEHLKRELNKSNIILIK